MNDTRPRGQGGKWTPAQATDLSRYAKGDRDQAARDAKAAYEREQRAQASSYDIEAVQRYWRGDRDQAARDANTAYRRRQRTHAGEDTRQIRAGTSLSEQEASVLRARLGELGIYEAEYVRDLILEDLGIQDTARRPAPKRPRRRQDGKTEGQQR